MHGHVPMANCMGDGRAVQDVTEDTAGFSAPSNSHLCVHLNVGGGFASCRQQADVWAPSQPSEAGSAWGQPPAAAPAAAAAKPAERDAWPQQAQQTGEAGASSAQPEATSAAAALEPKPSWGKPGQGGGELVMSIVDASTAGLAVASTSQEAKLCVDPEALWLCRNLCRHDQAAAGTPERTATTVTACSDTTPGGAPLTSSLYEHRHAAQECNLHVLRPVVCPGRPAAFHYAEPCRHHQACCLEVLCCALQASAPSASLPTPESSSVPGLASLQQPQQKLQLPVQAAARPQQQQQHQSLYSTGLGPSTGASETPASEADLLSGSLHTLSSGAGSMPQPIGPPAASAIAHSSQGTTTGSSGEPHNSGTHRCMCRERQLLATWRASTTSQALSEGAGAVRASDVWKVCGRTALMSVAGAEQQGQHQAAAPGGAGESSRMAGQGSSATLGGPTVQAPSRQSFQQDTPSSGPPNAWQQRRPSPAHAAPGAPSTSQGLGQQQQEPQVNNRVSMEAADTEQYRQDQFHV